MTLKKIRYIGTLPGVGIDFGGRTVEAKRGEPVEVPEAIADELLKRDDFTEIGTDVVNEPFPYATIPPTAGVPNSGTNAVRSTPPTSDLTKL